MKRRQRKPLRHVGIFRRRLKFSRRERAFAELWEKECQPVRGTDYGHGLLQDLLVIPRVDGWIGRATARRAFILCQRDATIVATVIQFLGTNGGFEFLRRALDADGWDIVARPDRRDNLPENERPEFYATRRPEHPPLPGCAELVKQLVENWPNRQYTREFAGIQVYRTTRVIGEGAESRLCFLVTSDRPTGDLPSILTPPNYLTAAQCARRLKEIEAERNGRRWPEQEVAS